MCEFVRTSMLWYMVDISLYQWKNMCLWPSNNGCNSVIGSKDMSWLETMAGTPLRVSVRPDALHLKTSSWWENGPEASSLHSMSRLHLQEGTSKHPKTLTICLYHIFSIMYAILPHLEGSFPAPVEKIELLSHSVDFLWTHSGLGCLDFHSQSETRFAVLRVERALVL